MAIPFRKTVLLALVCLLSVALTSMATAQESNRRVVSNGIQTNWRPVRMQELDQEPLIKLQEEEEQDRIKDAAERLELQKLEERLQDLKDLEEDDNEDVEGDLEAARRDEEATRDVIQKINPLRRPMSSIRLDTRDWSGQAPEDRSQSFTASYPSQWNSFQPAPVAVAWAAPNLRYQPLYFEDVTLERYGQTKGPWREVGDTSIHFFTSLALLPYHMKFDHWNACDHPLGYCRPGNRTAQQKQLQFWGW